MNTQNLINEIVKGDTKSNILFLILGLVIFGVCIAFAVDFGAIARQNSNLETTYFSQGFATVMSILNGLIAAVAFCMALYCLVKILNRYKTKNNVLSEAGGFAKAQTININKAIISNAPPLAPIKV